ncbi:hypothetical protein HGRIS_000713 [Hohenbuehelia grisea]|uniref:Uncharacterized protein n=1 Tax=Hohenbuehelia grisea TaxID=104357 RepID=A0ABR3JRZ4_9AGAR
MDRQTSTAIGQSTSSGGMGSRLRGAVEAVHGIGDNIRGTALGAVDTITRDGTKNDEIAARGRAATSEGIAKMQGRSGASTLIQDRKTVPRAELSSNATASATGNAPHGAGVGGHHAGQSVTRPSTDPDPNAYGTDMGAFTAGPGPEANINDHDRAVPGGGLPPKVPAGPPSSEVGHHHREDAISANPGDPLPLQGVQPPLPSRDGAPGAADAGSGSGGVGGFDPRVHQIAGTNTNRNIPPGAGSYT